MPCIRSPIWMAELWKPSSSGRRGDSITIEWNGKTFDLPLASLNAETRALAGLLSWSQPAPESDGEIRDWTDKEGRTIQAKFVEADERSLTLDWNGKITQLPMAMFSEASRELANQLRQSASSEDPQESESVEMDVNGELDLQKEYHGKTSRVKPPLGHSSALARIN